MNVSTGKGQNQNDGDQSSKNTSKTNGKRTKKRARDHKTWTDEEKNKLRIYIKKDYSVGKIAKLLKRSDGAVMHRIRVMKLPKDDENNSSRGASASPPRKRTKL